MPDKRVVAFAGDGCRTKLPDMVLVSENGDFTIGKKTAHIDPHQLLEGEGMTAQGTLFLGHTGEQSYCPMLLPLPLKWAAILLHHQDWSVTKTAGWIVKKISQWKDKTVSSRTTRVWSVASLCGGTTSESYCNLNSRVVFPCKKLTISPESDSVVVAHLNRMFPNLQTDENVTESTSNAVSQTSSNVHFATDMAAEGSKPTLNDVAQSPPVHNLMLPSSIPVTGSGRLFAASASTLKGRKRQSNGSDDELRQKKIARKTSANASTFVGKPFPRQSRVSRRASQAEKSKSGIKSFPPQGKVARKLPPASTRSSERKPFPKQYGARQATPSTGKTVSVAAASDSRTDESAEKTLPIDMRKGQKPSSRRASREPPAWRKLSVGSRVAIYWKDDEQYYSAVVLNRYGGSSNMSIRYDEDDLVERVDMAKEKIRVLDGSEEESVQSKGSVATKRSAVGDSRESSSPKQAKRKAPSSRSKGAAGALGDTNTYPSFPRQSRVARKHKDSNEGYPSEKTNPKSIPSFPKQGKRKAPIQKEKNQPSATSSAFPAFPRQFKISRKAPQSSKNDASETSQSDRIPSFPAQARKTPATSPRNETPRQDDAGDNNDKEVADPPCSEIAADSDNTEAQQDSTMVGSNVLNPPKARLEKSSEGTRAAGMADQMQPLEQQNVVFGQPHFLVTTNTRPGDIRLGVRECVLCQFRFRGRRGNRSLGTVSTACAQCGRCYHVACFAAAHNIERLKRENPEEYEKISGWENEMAKLSKRRRSVVVPDTTYATLTLPELEKPDK
uniref:Tudor domain-containing protein n=2 Tax=Grammatophora oceanica TaxID=210454 RepID=A0A7S1Y4U8_9STRA|mmetsp:Transcript_2869/g.3909  ORF Transcript_2869/g.3909 Transcript_2869/m.3909 type:complete len:783 (+) Transcript_2869:84-2432(+)